MRKFIIFIVCVAAFIFWFTGYIKSGQFEHYLDSHPNPRVNSKIEYYWALMLNMADYKKSAIYRYQRVVTKYPEDEAAPLALAAISGIFYEDGDNNATIEVCEKFLEKYPEHKKSSLIRRRIEFIKNN